MILSLLIFINLKNFYIEFLILILTGIIIFFSSERTALFLLFVIYFFYFFISNRKIFFLTVLVSFIILFNYNANSKLTNKYIDFTLHQTGLINLFKNEKVSKYKAFEKDPL